MLYTQEYSRVVAGLKNLSLSPAEQALRLTQWDGSFNNPSSPLNQVKSLLTGTLSASALFADIGASEVAIMLAIAINWVHHGVWDNGFGAGVPVSKSKLHPAVNQGNSEVDKALWADAAFWILADWSDFERIPLIITDRGGISLSLYGRSVLLPTWDLSLVGPELAPWLRLWSLLENSVYVRLGKYVDEVIQVEDCLLQRVDGRSGAANGRILVKYPTIVSGELRQLRALGANLVCQCPFLPKRLPADQVVQ